MVGVTSSVGRVRLHPADEETDCAGAMFVILERDEDDALLVKALEVGENSYAMT